MLIICSAIPPRALLVVLCGFVAAVLAAVPAVAPAAQPQQADYSGLEPFWTVAELLAGDQEVPAKAWEALFATPGYRTLQQRDNADRFLERLLPLALSPAKRDEAAALIAEQPATEMYLDHLRGAYEQRAELTAFRAELEGRLSLDEALAAAQAWLPAGSGARFGPPPVSFVIYQPDARGYGRIVMDLMLAFEQPEHVDGLLAHETHHVVRSGLQGSTDWGDLSEANLLWALDNLQAEGVADMIDKPSTLGVEDWGHGTTGSAMSLMTGRFREELGRVEQRLAEVDAILAEYVADPDAAEELGTHLRQTLVMGGHPVGYHMAKLIVASGGRERMIDRVDDPFDFVRAYNDAAATDPCRHHVFGGEALRGLERLEKLAHRQRSPTGSSTAAARSPNRPWSELPSWPVLSVGLLETETDGGSDAEAPRERSAAGAEGSPGGQSQGEPGSLRSRVPGPGITGSPRASVLRGRVGHSSCSYVDWL